MHDGFLRISAKYCYPISFWWNKSLKTKQHIKIKHREKLSEGILLLQDNARPETHVPEKIQDLLKASKDLKAPCYPDIFILVINHWKVNGTHVTRKWWALIKKESISNAKILHWSHPLIYYALGSLASISMEIVCRYHFTH